MATYRLSEIKDPDNEFVFELKGISYVNGLQDALNLKANEANVVHIGNNETITGYKTFSNGARVSGTLDASAIETDGNIKCGGAIRAGSSVYSRRASWPIVGSIRVDSNDDPLGYAKLEVDTSNNLRLIAADADNVDTTVIMNANSRYVFYGAATSVVDYGNTANSIKIGYSGSALTSCDYLAAYGTNSAGDRVIKDIATSSVTVGNATNSTMATTVKDYGHTSSTQANEGIMIGWGGSSITEAENLAVYHYNSTTRQAYIKDMNITDAYHLSLSGRTLGLNFGSSTVISCGTVTLPGTNVVFNQVGTDSNTLYCL